MGQFLSLLDDFRLTTAEILYHLPDHPHLLQAYVWQDYDHIPDYPKLHHFLEFWRTSLDGSLHSVRVTYSDSMHIQEVRIVDWSGDV
jgi:uncharacterized protein Usg